MLRSLSSAFPMTFYRLGIDVFLGVHSGFMYGLIFGRIIGLLVRVTLLSYGCMLTFGEHKI